jgi:hypothetical protein
MGTRSNIGIRNIDQTIICINTHWDGYPQHNGTILLANYNSVAIVQQLMALGDLSVLGAKLYPDVSKPHTFEFQQPDVCVAYGRDRGEDNTQSTLFDNITEYELNMDCDIEYQYLFDNDHWIWRGRNGEWKELTVKDCV